MRHLGHTCPGISGDRLTGQSRPRGLADEPERVRRRHHADEVPDSVSSLSSSQALYAAMPAPTPRTTRTGMGPGFPGSAFDGLDGQEPLLDLTKGDREWLFLTARLYQGPDVLEQALTEL